MYGDRLYFLKFYLEKYLVKSGANTFTSYDQIYEKYLCFIEDRKEWILPYEIFDKCITDIYWCRDSNEKSKYSDVKMKELEYYKI